MDPVLSTVVGIVVVALLLDYTNGFHDSANSMPPCWSPPATSRPPGQAADPAVGGAGRPHRDRPGHDLGGWRIVHTMGQRMTELRPARGMAAETGAAVALFGSTALGAPVSTTHTVAGAVTGWGR
jgi:phosphate/sulfate permease